MIRFTREKSRLFRHLMGVAWVLTSVAFAQSTINGRVRDDAGRAVAGAELTIQGTAIRAETDDAGEFRLRSVPAGLLRVRLGDGVVAQHVECRSEVDRRGDVRVDQRHRCPLGQLLACDCVQLLARELLVLLVFAHCNASFRCYVDWSMGVCWIASA